MKALTWIYPVLPFEFNLELTSYSIGFEGYDFEIMLCVSD